MIIKSVKLLHRLHVRHTTISLLRDNNGQQVLGRKNTLSWISYISETVDVGIGDSETGIFCIQFYIVYHCHYHTITIRFIVSAVAAIQFFFKSLIANERNVRTVID